MYATPPVPTPPKHHIDPPGHLPKGPVLRGSAVAAGVVGAALVFVLCVLATGQQPGAS